MSDLDKQIEDAIRKGASLKDIAAHLDQSEDPEHKAWANTYFKRAPIEAATPKNDGPSEGFGGKVNEFAKKETEKIQAEKKATENQFGIPDWMEAPVKIGAAGAGFAAGNLLGNRLFGGGKPPDDNTPPPPPPDGKPNISQSEAQKQIEDLKLQREKIKTERAQMEHENWLAKNTLSDAEKAFGRKATSPAELKLMQTAVQQQAGKAPVAPTPGGPAPMAELPVIQSPATTPAQTWGAPVNQAPVAPTTAPAPAPVTPAVTQPANVVTTATTPEAAAEPIAKAEAAKEAVTPTAEKTKAKTEPKIPKPEFFKNAPSAERWMYGSMTKYMDQPASAQAVIARAADYLPEGTKWEMQPGGEGGGIHPEQKQHLNRFVSEQLGIPLKEGKLPDDFKFTTENRNKLAASVQSELESHAKAGTLGKLGKGALAAATLLGISEAVKAAQKGDYGPLREAGFNIGGPIAASAIGLTALSKAAGVPFGLATYSGGLNEGEEKELAYRRKVGAGRGISPPSAYMR